MTCTSQKTVASLFTAFRLPDIKVDFHCRVNKIEAMYGR